MTTTEFAQRIKDPLIIAIQNDQTPERDKRILAHVLMMVNDILTEISNQCPECGSPIRYLGNPLVKTCTECEWEVSPT